MEVESEIIVEKLEVENPLLITSFPGIGLVGTIASGHMIMELNLKQVGVLESRYIPPVATLYEGVVMPPIRVYEHKELNFVLIHSDIPIVPQLSYDISVSILDWAQEIGVKRVLTLAGIATFEESRRVFGAATRKELLEELKEHVEIFRMGTISGVAGSILVECVARKIDGFALLGETAGFNPDPRAAAEVIRVMNKIFNWNISVERLEKEAEMIEAQMQKLAEQTKVQEMKKEELPMYG